MTGEQIRGLGRELSDFLGEFGDSFGRVEHRRKLQFYVGGQLSELPRKSIEPIALEAGIAPRNLQEFLASDDWNEDRLGEHCTRLVLRDHSDPQAIGVIDESGHPKKGAETAGVSRQYCGNTGKMDNCVRLEISEKRFQKAIILQITFLKYKRITISFLECFLPIVK